MALVRLRKNNDLNPWSAFGDLEAQLNQFFAPYRNDASASTWMPAVDLKETEGAYVLEADVPGLTKNDIELELMENVLTIKGERKSESEKKEKGYHHVERSYGAFQRVVELPGPVTSEGVEAKFENGVLNVTLPKREDIRPKRIEVRAS